MTSDSFSIPPRVYIASDHNGNAARAYIMKILHERGVLVLDMGPAEAEGKVDYPDMAAKVCKMVVESWGEAIGILVCGTGTGMCIAANKIGGIRAALATDRPTAELAREHNDANVLVLGQWRNSLGSMDEIVKAFLNTPWGAGRHVSRVKKLMELEK